MPLVKCAKGGGAVQHSWGSASKRDPVHDGWSICTETRFQQTHTKTALSHVWCPHNCWIMNTEWFFSMTDRYKDAYISRARKCTRVLHGCAIKKVYICYRKVDLSILYQSLCWNECKNAMLKRVLNAVYSFIFKHCNVVAKMYRCMQCSFIELLSSNFSLIELNLLRIFLFLKQFRSKPYLQTKK